MYSNHVRRNPGQASQQPFDHRMPTNPQPIPNSAPRNLAATGAARSFPSYSPAQSPQHAGQYFPSPSASTNPHELNRGHGAVVSGTAPLTVNKVNGTQPVQMYATPQRPAFPAQYQQQMPQQQYTTPVTKFTSQPQVHSGGHYPQQSHHPAPAGLIQQSGSPYHQMYIHPNMPSVRPRYSQNAHNPGIINPTQSPLQPTSPTYYHPSPSYFQNMQQVPGYYDPQHMTYQHPPPSQPIVIAPQPTPPTPNSATAPRRAASKVVIRDPNTGADITNDLLRKEGTPTGRSSATSTPPAASHGNEQIAAQFAAQVAAAATGSPGRSPVPSHVPISVAPVRTPVHFAPQPRSSQSVVGIPSGVDTSLPPPTMPPNMSIPPPDLNAMQTPSPKAYPVVTHAPAASPQDVPAKIPTAQVRPQVQKTTAPDVAPQITPIVSKRSEQPPIAVVQPQQQNNNSSPAPVIYQATEDEELKIEKTAPEAEPTELISNAGVELTLEKISDEKTADVEKATTEEDSSKDQVDKEAAAAEPTDVDVVDVTV
uniref:Uncharacterized protein n=1 Tax=Ciona savignyi TaxID=51511 RepID=H2ZK84_CIOSA